MVALCSIGEGEVPLYRVDGVQRSVTDDDGEHGAPGGPRRGRGQGGGQGVLAIIIIVLAQE